jgi:hypothetical protein
VHAITATELMLKEKLTRIHPALIYRNIDTRTPNKEKTVSLSDIPNRLNNFGISLSDEHKKLINNVSRWRHQIIHHEPSFNIEAAEKQLPLLIDFIASFLRKEFENPIEKFLPKKLFKVVKNLLSDWQKAIGIARSEAKKEGGVISEFCPECGVESVMCLRTDAVVFCHLCGAKLYMCDECDGCGRKIVISYKPTTGENYCDECIEAAGDRYIQMQIDLEKEK